MSTVLEQIIPTEVIKVRVWKKTFQDVLKNKTKSTNGEEKNRYTRAMLNFQECNKSNIEYDRDTKTLKVKNRINIRFQFSDELEFVPIGVCFRRLVSIAEEARSGLSGGSVEDRLGRAVMPIDKIVVADKAVTFRDLHHVDGGRGDNRRYKYFIIIQNKDGRIGIVDPEIENGNAD